jgi:hypothetical protein
MMGDGVMPKKEARELIVDRREVYKSVAPSSVDQKQIRFHRLLLPLVILQLLT